ncbi:UTRA domain-containing protein [Vibrio caribbeanicus]|uniref:UTRA domain-containing protein n=1 Tax=Vibrio caribbeanicus TaxID=701175 RepID=UPI002284150A|nr:UTRA domain-containing protein [Vibrio caribbeanicus]MCY9844936.1 UTRA domain-containing protein [Vibrio caribbeanicus]
MQYIKIKELIAEQIDSGMLTPQQKLPSERQLAESFNTTRVTLREALSLLESEGRVYREDRRGWFISPLPLRYDPACSASFFELSSSQNRNGSIEVISAENKLINKTAVELLSLKPFSEIYQIERVRCLEGRPVSYVTHYIPTKYFSNLLDADLTSSLKSIYRERYGVLCHGTHFKLSSGSLLGMVASALRATEGTPALAIERRNVDSNGEIIDASIEFWKHDAISVESFFSKN